MLICELCLGKGQLTDPVLFRTKVCPDCRGLGKVQSLPTHDWSEFFGLPLEHEEFIDEKV